MFVFSPSNISSWTQCPRRFQAQSITKELPWKATAAKSRGSLVHTAIQKAMREGIQAVPSWPDGLSVAYTQTKIQASRGLVAAGWTVDTEHELTITKDMQKAPDGWWDNNAWLRARADAILLPPDPTVAPVMLVDIKTGKIYDRDGFQLRVECLLAHIIFKAPVVQYSYWYVDEGQSVSDTLDFNADGMNKCKDIFESIQKMQFAMDNNYYPATKNRFCRWCGLNNTQSCGA